MTNKITIETINGVAHTVVWVGVTNPDKWQVNNEVLLHMGMRAMLGTDNRHHHIATALPPLPRRPTAKDVRLLHLYAAHGLKVCSQIEGRVYPFMSSDFWNAPITHAITEDGERVDVALIEGGV